MYSNFRNINYLQTGRILIILSFVINSCILFAQRTLTLEGTIINDNTTGIWAGIDIPRSVPTAFTYRNNTITSVNSAGYMLQAGDESPGRSNNNLAGEVITGNKFTWNGTDMKSITHGVFTGYNINAIIKYNYLDKVPMGIIRKSNGMTNTSGGVAYNIVNNPPATAVVVKGINNVAVFNNTFYSARTISETWRGLIDIYTNTDIVPNGSATGTKIFNNIFYTKHQIANINVYANENLTGFESDYNVFYCEDGAPMFKVAGVTKTFAQWQALGYDTHSVVINPNFINFTDFVPGKRLDYGTNLDTTWKTGLSVDAVWGTTDPVTTNQNGTWQVGARIYKAGNGNVTERKAKIYPNPAHDFFNISIQDSTMFPLTIKIIDLSGKIVFINSLEQGIKNVQIPKNLTTSLYIISLESGNLIRQSQKLIIAK